MMELNKIINIKNNVGIWKLHFVEKLDWDNITRYGIEILGGCGCPRIEFHETEDDFIFVTLTDEEDGEPTKFNPNKVVVFEPISKQVALYEYYDTEYDDDEIYCESI